MCVYVWVRHLCMTPTCNLRDYTQIVNRKSHAVNRRSQAAKRELRIKHLALALSLHNL